MKTNISALINLISEEERILNSKICTINDYAINISVEELDGKINVIEDNKEMFDLDLKQIKKVNNSLLFNENNKLVSNRLDRVIDILNEVCEIKEEGPQIDKLYYELGLLSYEQNLNLE